MKHNHTWIEIGLTVDGPHYRCAECLMHKVRIFGGWGYRCEGDLGIGFWDSEEAAMIAALKRLSILVPIAGGRQHERDQ